MRSRDGSRIERGAGWKQLFADFPDLEGIAPHSAEQLLDLAIRRHLGEKEILAHEGRECGHLPLVLRGSLRVYKSSEDGKELTLYRIAPGESCVLTATCILNNRSFPAVAEAEEGTDLLLVPARLFARLVETDGQWRRFVFSLYSHRLEIVLRLVEEVAFRHMDSRLAAYLIARGAENNGFVVKTHLEIASELGTSREVVTRILKEFELSGLVKTQRGRITIVDPMGLQKRV
jgi:CRP/FNR family transcriptional regulator